MNENQNELFELWLNAFYAHFAGHLGPDQNGILCTADDARGMGADESDLKRQFLEGIDPEKAAWDEYDSMCALG